MLATTLLSAAFERIHRSVHQAASGLDGHRLAYRPEAEANSIAWLVWHLTRVQDTHVADIAGRQQLWIEGGWPARTGVDRDGHDTGRGDGASEVAAIHPTSAAALLAYHDEVVGRTLSFLATLRAADLDMIVDASYDPPVAVGTRLLSVVNDNLQHVGQARYLRGILDRMATD